MGILTHEDAEIIGQRMTVSAHINYCAADGRDAEINRALTDISLGEYPGAARRRYSAAIGLTGEDRVAVYS